jgi:AcrR family transcriptional regulator
MGATLDLLAQRPAESLSATDVVQRARVSRPTLYQHFGDLTALIVAAVTMRLQALFDETLPDAPDAVGAVGAQAVADENGSGASAIQALLQRLLDEADLFRHALHGPSGYPVMRELAELLARRLQTHGPLRRALDHGAAPEHLARFVGHGAVGIVADWLDVPGEERESVSTVTERLTALLLFQLDHRGPTGPNDTTQITDRADREEARA